jgi:adenylylsulfate kinase
MIERALFLTGTVGTGKTTVASQLGDLLRERGEPHGVVDLDWLSEYWPPPEDDRFNVGLVIANLRAVAANYAEAGARSLVLSGVVTSAAHLASLGEAIGACPLALVRLVGPTKAIRARLQSRHPPWESAALQWHLDRVQELSYELDACGLEPIEIDATRDPREVAERVLEVVEWFPGSPAP